MTKVHVQARRYAAEGYTILLIGHAGHEEVVGTMGEAPESTILVESVDDAEALELPADAKVAYITQTTLSVDETGEIIAALRRRFPDIYAPKKEDICYATSNRQWAVKELLAEVDLLLVIGSRNSSNSNRLVEVARANGVDAAPDRRRDARSTRPGSTASSRSGSRRARRRPSGSSTGSATGSARAASTTSAVPAASTRTSTFRLPVELRRELALAETQS